MITNVEVYGSHQEERLQKSRKTAPGNPGQVRKIGG